jgi:hypothetical protein
LIEEGWSADDAGEYHVCHSAVRAAVCGLLFGTPYTKALHVVERYRLRDYDEVKDAVERNLKENWQFAGDVFSRHRGKFLQLHLTVEDDGAFTMRWTATLTYVPGGDQLQEVVCAENPHEYYNNKGADVPKADKPDF